MKCPISKKECSNIKCYHITNIDKNGNTESLDLCKKCFFNDLEEPKEKTSLIVPSIENKICECGLSFEEYLKTGILGCHLCYYTFQSVTSLDIEKKQSSPSREEFHVGKVPSQQKKEVSEVDFKDFLLRLEQNLSSCVKKENYEEAHRLKFVIMGLKALIEQFETHSNNSQQQKLIQEEIKKLISKEL